MNKKPFVDCHCHLEEKDYPDLGEVLQRMEKAGVACVASGRNREQNERVLRLKRSGVKAAVGISPHDAQGVDLEDELAWLEVNVNEACAIGEIGLDYHHFHSQEERGKQGEVFEAMLGFAEKTGKPAIIHSRKAEGEVLEALDSFNCRAVLHCFLVPQLIERVLEAGHGISLPTLKNKSRVKLIKRLPLNKILCETDSPFLWTGRNEPANVVSVYDEVARVKGVELSEVRDLVGSNAEELFGGF
ncbi:hypothetical protein AUJ15_02825 [Candidatus Micrarchaeota archaeon CG1_02_55_41]|nr:MAG: hypothetical protein AUJ15_02825 [Candidatus Micrarchaeota archaeon CG1_02_55_41]